MKPASDMILVSNRLPITTEMGPNGPVLKPSSGGLVTALRPVLKTRKGYWIGWPGDGPEDQIQRLLAKERSESQVQLVPVSLTPAERKGFYAGFSNEIVWPLFHDLQSRCNFDPTYWEAYVHVNRKFADVVGRVSRPDSLIWVHDYHLMLVGDFLRERRVRSRLGFFLHIPFPPLDIFEKLPWRSQILRALFAYDAVGFQTPRDQRNFLGCVRHFLPDIEMHREDEQVRVSVGNRSTLIRTFPIGIDYDEFAQHAAQPEIAERAAQIRRDMHARQIVLGVDRLDYTKGVPDRLRAFRHLLSSSPEMRRQLSLVQIVVPSREHIPKYRELKLEIETLVSQINGQYGDPGWMPIHYIHRALERPELVALYRAADIALITPLKDGMNLVAKEFCASQEGDQGVLILSEFAGAAAQLGNGSILVNPYDIQCVAEALHQACAMEVRERVARMRKLRRRVRNENVFRWCERFCSYLENQPTPMRAIA
ncbi:MAG TPA: trehalose-6-phosphate synthase [Acidobacteriaceae bacterium]|nr:trehalose-6-phosphate synthase [Acidobacteriaceae bacterium]